MAGNILLNPGLEVGEEPWLTHTVAVNTDPKVHFRRTEALAHGGRASALLHMRDPAEAEGAEVYYLIQEVAPERFPEVVSGFYRVENWMKGTGKQYLQFVVIVFGAENLSRSYDNHQIRYILAGVGEPPIAIANAHFVFLDADEPAQGRWIPFKVNVGDDFRRLWGDAPQDFDKIRVLFEVRWDGKVAGQGTPQADVYYDDLYMGAAQ